MPDLDMALAANLAAARDFLTATDRIGAAAWTAPRAPGKWSPAQLTEHVAMTYDSSCKIMRGEAVGLPSLPRFLRPLLRRFILRKILETGSFGRPGKTFKPFEPVSEPSTPAAGRARLEGAVATFEKQVRAGTPIGDFTFEHPAFGKLHVSDYVRFQEVHTLHHMNQLPKA